MDKVKKYNYGFLFKKSKLPKARLKLLLETEAFIECLNVVMEKKHRIEDIDIYNIAKELFFPMLREYLTEGFKEEYKSKYGCDEYHKWSMNYRIFGQATKSFSKVLFEDENQWQKDFEKYKQ